ncbi:hypothetical protein GCM10023116_06730 [Kistimonas scapharcae]|uniref:Uncharacterized protein n=1 Tax=Kistimonas scapharcae TaxID=1036133 RepID=A0ABP8UZ15_9GAMM
MTAARKPTIAVTSGMAIIPAPMDVPAIMKVLPRVLLCITLLSFTTVADPMITGTRATRESHHNGASTAYQG